MNYIVGIDQGSTKTHVALAESNGRILCTSKAPGAEHHFDGLPKQTGFLYEAVSNLEIPFDWNDVTAVGGGITGIDFPGEHYLFENYLQTLFPKAKINCENDVMATLKGGSLNTFGAAICCGTGGNIVTISPNGQKFIYGMHLDRGLNGGSALRERGIWAVIRSDAGRIPKTALTEHVLKFFNVPTVMDLIIANNKAEIQYSDMKHLPVVVCQCASEGDRVAIDILQNMGHELADAVADQAVRFKMDNLAFDLVLSGSVFKGPGTHLSDAVAARIKERCPLATTINARYEPVVGGVIMALEQIYGNIGQDIFNNIGETAAEHDLLRSVSF